MPDQYGAVVYRRGLQEEYRSCCSLLSLSGPTFLIVKDLELSLSVFYLHSNFLALSHGYSGIRYLLLTANRVCSNELGDLMLNITRMTLKQNRSVRDEKIIAVHPVLPGDVISVTEKGGGEGRDDNNERSQRVPHGRQTQRGTGEEEDKRDRETERWDGAEKLGI